MSEVRDFSSQAHTRERSGTAATRGTPLSPVARQNTLDRRASASSRHSNNSTDGMRFRNPQRSGTAITTLREPEKSDPSWQPGAEPGIDTSADDDAQPKEVLNLKAKCDINIIDFSEYDVLPRKAVNETLEKVLEQPRRDDMPCRWISVNGLSWDVIKCLGNKYHLHRLAIEDIVHTHTRTKVDWYADHACVILTLQKLVLLHEGEYKEDLAQYEDVDYNDSNEKGLTNKLKRQLRSRRKWWEWWRPKKKVYPDSPLPYFLDKDGDGQVDTHVHAHSGTTVDSEVKQTRTLHRYELATVPEHTMYMEEHSTLAPEGLAVSVEQVAIFLLADNTVISFFEQSAEDVEEPIRDRLKSTETILRSSCDASLLVQAIIDSIVDLAVPVRDAYNRSRKELQVEAMISPNIKTSRDLHIFGEEIDMLQNLIKPIVHLVNALRDHNAESIGNQSVASPHDSTSAPPRTEKPKRDREGAPSYNRKFSEYRKTGFLKPDDSASSVSITPLAHIYFGDVLDHCITMIQAMEQMDESASNISTLIFNTVGARSNNLMMIFTVVTVLFAPLTFISGYFGQNFAEGQGLSHPFAFFWTISIPVMVVFAVIVFAAMLWDKWKNWVAKRGVERHRSKRRRGRRGRKYF